MSNFIKTATVLFFTKTERQSPDAKQTVLAELDQQLEAASGYGLNLLVFSEGVEAFGQNIDDAEELENPGPFLQKYMSFAKEQHCHVAGSVKIVEDGQVHNSIAFIDDQGAPLGAYHKVNLTQTEIDMGLTSGRNPVVVDTKFGRIGGIICFDLNFDELLQEYIRQKPDILTFASMYHGGLMQQMWAYQCRSFFIAALPFIGGAVLDPFGRQLAATNCYTSIAKTKINLDRVMVHLDFNREKFPEIERKYGDEVIIDIPPNIAPALIYSTTDKRTSMDIVEEFDLELIDDYFTRSRAANARNRQEGIS